MNKKYCTILAFLVWGCHGQTSSSTSNNQGTSTQQSTAQTQAPAKPIEKGMTDTVYCAGDASQKYAVYVPPQYDAKKKWPVIYFFDPHGVGNVPLKLYKDLADKYGYILAGTYNSKNGMQGNETEKVAQTFMQDSWQRLSVNTNEIYLFGFSGGARVATSVAINDGGITGVAACGAGFGERSPQIRQPFNFISFVGDKDFNYTELKNLDHDLDNTQLKHQLVVYHGKHQWPPVSIAEQAFQWFDLNAIMTNVAPKNDSLVKAVMKVMVAEIDKSLTKKNDVEAYFAYKKLINFLGGLIEDGKFSAAEQKLAQSDKVKQYLQDEQSNDQKEQDFQASYMNHLERDGLPWWRDAVGKLRDEIKKDSLSPDALRDQRTLSALSLACYMGASRAFQAQNDGATAHFLEIYKMVDPTNPEHSYLYASIYARQNSTDQAMSSLDDAVKLGFNDIKRIQSDSNFASLKSSAAFQDLLKKIAALPAKVDVTQ